MAEKPILNRKYMLKIHSVYVREGFKAGLDKEPIWPQTVEMKTHSTMSGKEVSGFEFLFFSVGN